jgi:UDP-N-acetylglucosamine/UDP-N-acetylgalactosamine diphosphorylase
MSQVPQAIRERLRQHDQEHLLAFWDRLDEAEQNQLLAQLQRLDLHELRNLYALKDQKTAVPNAERIQPIERVEPDVKSSAAIHQRGVDAFRAGQVAMLVVAGGQGSRLGFEHPKGMFPIGPVSNKPLFQIHAEKILALRRRHGKPVPFLVMTSPATHQETLAFFHLHRNFGLPDNEVWFFCQGTMPALDLATGRLLLEKPGQLFLSPNGHGGTLTGLAESGLLVRLRKRGIQHVYYFQVDNPLVRLDDTLFLGRHIHDRADVSSKVIVKERPEEKLGLFVLVDGKLTIIEYSDIPDTLSRAADERGRLRLWAGNPAIHLFEVDFLERITCEQHGLPWHLAKKKVPYLNNEGRLVQPEGENALKFEMFIFDVLPQAERWTVQPIDRRAEFEPLKNATGNESPESVRQALTNQAAGWLESAGVTVPRNEDGRPVWPLEISPLFALDADELKQKLRSAMRVDRPTYLE